MRGKRYQAVCAALVQAQPEHPALNTSVAFFLQQPVVHGYSRGVCVCVMWLLCVRDVHPSDLLDGVVH